MPVRLDLDGFDIVALHMSSRESLSLVQERSARLGADHTPVQDRGPHEAVVDVTDPDGTLLRFYWKDLAQEPDVFLAFAFRRRRPARDRPVSHGCGRPAFSVDQPTSPRRGCLRPPDA